MEITRKSLIATVNFKRRVVVLVGFILLLFTQIACRKDVENQSLNSYTGSSYSEVFESFWQGMNSNYMFWDMEKVNWDNMYITFKPRFEALDKLPKSTKTNQMAAQYIVNMTENLMDSHLTITFNQPFLYIVNGTFSYQSQTFSPAATRHYIRGDRNPIVDSVFTKIIPTNYLTKDKEVGAVPGFRAVCGVIPATNKDILYLNFSNFYLQSIYSASLSSTQPIKPVLEKYFRYLKDPSVGGLIIDLRGNGGGAVSDLEFLIGRMITSPYHVTYFRYKNGNGRLDYTSFVKGIVNPYSGSSVDLTNKPIAILIDMYSVSMSEITTLAVKRIFPKHYIVGETSYGATGPIASSYIKYNGGQFVAAYFSQAYMAAADTRDVNFKSYENKGITPDYTVAYDTLSIKKYKRDVQLDRAIELVDQN